jgi:chromosome segregation ATPase
MNKKQLILPLFGLLIGFSSCGTKEIDQLQTSNDSLRNELETTMIAMETLQQVSAWMDSIDMGRENLEMSLEVGIRNDDFVARMESITNYVRDSEQKILQLEEELAKSSGQSQAYSGTISRLRRELQSSNEEVVQLQNMVAQYRDTNQELLTAVSLREEEIQQKDVELSIKRQELQLLENRIYSLMEASQVNQADALFARAQAVEEAANRTRLAPKKKRETYLEAIDLYRQAANLGNPEAQSKMEELQKLVNN